MKNKVTYNMFKKEFWTWENLLNKQKFREVKQKHNEGMKGETMKIFGFRSKTNWKMFLATLGYGFIAMFIIVAIINPSSEEVAGDVEAEDPIANVEEEEAEVEEPVVEETVVEKAEREAEEQAQAEAEAEAEAQQEFENSLTVSQKNAIQTADKYIKYSAFSKSGLVEQLEYEGYSNEDATFAVENVEVDWREQAVIQAKNYLDYSAFSRSGLIDQLLYEGHSQEDANYAVNQVGL